MRSTLRQVNWARWIVPAGIVLSLLLWGLVHRWWFMAGDDYLLITQGGDVGGRFSFSDWLGFLAHEWGEVNGRTSDSLLRLVLRPGPWFYPLFAPAMLTATGLAVGALLATTRQAEGRVGFLVGLALVPFLLWLHPPFAGDAVLWTAGAMNYVLPLGAACLGLLALTLVLGGRDLPWPLVLGAALVLALTDSMQEIVSSALGAVAVGVIVTARGRLSRKAWVLAGASLLAFACHMCAPGLWARSSRVTEASGSSGIERLLHAVAISSSNFWTRTCLIWLLLGAALLWLGVSATRRRWLPLVAGAAVLGVGVASQLYAHRAPADDAIDVALPAQLLPHTLLLVALLALAFISGWLALADAIGTVGWVPVVAWIAFAGSTVFVFGSGVVASRAHFLPAALLLITFLALGSALTRNLAARSQEALSLALCGALGCAALVWFDSAWVGLQANYRAVQEQVVAPLREAAPGSEVVLPATLPDPTMSYGFAFLMPRYEEALKVYYDLPGDITLRNP